MRSGTVGCPPAGDGVDPLKAQESHVPRDNSAIEMHVQQRRLCNVQKFCVFIQTQVILPKGQERIRRVRLEMAQGEAWLLFGGQWTF